MIVRALPEQAEALTRIAVAAKRHWKYPERWMEIWLPVLTVSGEYVSVNETWVAIVGGEPAAWYSLKETDGELWLDNLWVLPGHMGKGIGGELFNHALERSRLRGAGILKIEADPNAEQFYLRMGARCIGEHRGEMEGEPRILPVMAVGL